ncbi:MAG: glycyl-radical enzyme activating protein [Gemmatimonadota bacterium]|nr:MAG: glycyl-radical enzyme activating protein [Gemmatimonadota bacterium]
MEPLPLIVDIKRHSLEDGPGIRSVVFFKGCPLRCVFCQNPETQDPRMEISFSVNACIRCEMCQRICPEGAIRFDLPGRIQRDRCLRCGACAAVCPGKGLRVVGSYFPVETLSEILLRDLPFYRHSGGGVTLAGGEPTLHLDYLEPLLQALKASEIHVVLETSGYFDYGSFRRRILPYIDIIYYDIKVADPQVHRKYTGKTNGRILGNVRRLLQERAAVVYPRIPLIPNITATRENLSAILHILCDAGAEHVSLLPYNPMGREAAAGLGNVTVPLPESFMRPDEEKAMCSMFAGLIQELERSPRPRQEV